MAGLEVSSSEPFPLSAATAGSAGGLRAGIFPGLSNTSQSGDFSLAPQPEEMTELSPCPRERVLSPCRCMMGSSSVRLGAWGALGHRPGAVWVECETPGGPTPLRACTTISLPSTHPPPPLSLEKNTHFIAGMLQLPDEPMRWKRSSPKGASGKAIAFPVKKKAAGSRVGALIMELKVPC